MTVLHALNGAMKAMSLAAPRRLDFIELPEPPPPGPGEALVRIHAVGVCGTDLSGYLGKMPFIQYPRILGHELGAEVLAVGGGVNNVKPGDRCSVEPYLNCGVCPSCRLGRSNCCEKLEVLGVHCDGGLRPRVVLPARKLHPASDLSFEQLALVETLAIGCHAVARGTLEEGDTVLVIGAGPIGLAVIEFARLGGANLFVVEPDEGRRGFVRGKNAITGIHPRLEPSEFAELTGGRLARIVFDATGNAACMSGASEYAGFGGRVVFVGITNEPVPLNDALFHRRELALLATRNAVAGDFARIIALMGAGEIDTRPWITHRMGFAEAPSCFPKLLEPGSRVVKALIRIE